VVYLGERHYTHEDELQAVCIFLSETQPGLKTFPRNFIPPAHATLAPDRKQLHYSNGYSQNYVGYLEKEARYNADAPKQIIIRAVGGTIFDLGKKHGNYTPEANK
jgi:hypothetical protein